MAITHIESEIETAGNIQNRLFLYSDLIKKAQEKKKREEEKEKEKKEE